MLGFSLTCQTVWLATMVHGLAPRLTCNRQICIGTHIAHAFLHLYYICVCTHKCTRRAVEVSGRKECFYSIGVKPKFAGLQELGVKPQLFSQLVFASSQFLSHLLNSSQPTSPLPTAAQPVSPLLNYLTLLNSSHLSSTLLISC